MHSPLLALLLLVPIAGGAADPTTQVEPTSEAVALKLYDIVDLMQVADSPAPALGLAQLATPAIPPTTGTLDTFLSRYFDPPIAKRIRAHGELRAHTLFLTCTDHLHRHVESVLRVARTQAGLQITTSFQLFSMTTEVRSTRYALPGFTWQTDQAHAYAELTGPECEALAETMGKDPDVQQLSYPPVTTFIGQLGHAASVQQRAYARLPARPDLGMPEPATLMLGDTLAVRARTTADRSFIHLHAQRSCCRLLEMKRFSIGPGADGKPAFVEEPVVRLHQETITQSIPQGHGLLIATDLYSDAGAVAHTGFLLIRPRLIDVDAGATPAAAPQPAQAGSF